MAVIVSIGICGYHIKHMGKEEEEMNMMKIESNKQSIVRAYSQGSLLLINPSIPTSSRSWCVRKFNSYLLFSLSLKARKFAS